jgi:hypothetical protein
MRSSLVWVVTQLMLAVVYRRFKAARRSHLRGTNSPRRMPGTGGSVVTYGEWLGHCLVLLESKLASQNGPQGNTKEEGGTPQQYRTNENAQEGKDVTTGSGANE